MTVKEVEERTGLPRANIRYYESEGLIHPARGENGYRDYRQEDVDTLLKIKLLRQVGFSLEVIRALQAGELDLEPALEGRLAALTSQQTELGQAAGICRAMREDHVRYDTLDRSSRIHTVVVGDMLGKFLQRPDFGHLILGIRFGRLIPAERRRHHVN